MKTADVFWFRYQLFVAMQSIYHPVLRKKFSHLLAEPLMRSDSLACRLIVLDIPERLTPILLLADWVQKSVKMQDSKGFSISEGRIGG